MSLTPEALACRQIDAPLVATGWFIQEVKAVSLSAGAGIAEQSVNYASALLNALTPPPDRRPEHPLTGSILSIL